MRIRNERAAAAGLLILLSACASAPKPEPEAGVRTYPEAVAIGCVKDRPERPQSLLERFSDEVWARLAPGAMARAVEAQGGERLNYEDRLSAATAGCKEAP